MRARVESVRRELARAHAAIDASRWSEGLPIAKSAAAAAAETRYQPLSAEALLTLGQIERESGDTTAARTHLVEAALTAEASHADTTAAQAWTQRVMLAYDDAKFPEGDEVARSAQAAVARTGDDRLLATLENAVATLRMGEGNFDDAMTRYEHTLALRRKIPSTPPLLIATTISNIGNIYLGLGKYDQAIGSYREALALKIRAVGKDHPSVAATLNNMANAYGDQQRFEESLDAYQRALAIWQVALGPKHRDVAMCLGNIGATLDDMGRYKEAVANDRQVLALEEEAVGPDHPDVAIALCNLGRALVDDGRPNEALPLLERGRRIQEHTIGMGHVDYGYTLSALAQAHETLGHHDVALALGQRSLAVRQKALGHEAPAPLLFMTIGEAQLGLARTAAARVSFDRALALLQDQSHPDRQKLATARFDMARALWDGGGDRRRARELATSAHDLDAAVGERAAKDLARVTNWLATHTP